MTMSFQDRIQAVINEYRKSSIQSEAEVRSKLIVPLLDAMGYPSELRAEEFNVYGYDGSRATNAKPADFLLFRDPDFASHRSRTQKNIKWVNDNSLLVVEAKKPDKMSEDYGQAKFYTMWTRSVAYIVTDGERLCAYYYVPTRSDYQVLKALVDDLAKLNVSSELEKLSYHCLLSVKESGEKTDGFEYDSVPRIQFTHEAVEYIRKGLGRNADGLDEEQVMNRFVKLTNMFLAEDIRYDIPEFMIDIPRRVYPASLCIDGVIFPILRGEVTEYYRNDELRYYFKGDYIDAEIRYKKDSIEFFEMGFSVLDNSVSERLKNFNLVRKCFQTENVSVIIEDQVEKTERVIFSSVLKKTRIWKTRKEKLKEADFWNSEMEKLKAIEEYYEVSFDLYPVYGDDIGHMYSAIDIVYDGIVLNENCKLTLPIELFEKNTLIDVPTLFEEEVDIPLDELTIFGITFVPRRSAILPCRVRVNKKNGYVRLPGCVGYDVKSI